MKSTFLFSLLLLCFDLFARAGGGGVSWGGGSGGLGGYGGTIFSFIVLIVMSPFIIAYQLYLNFRVNRRKNKVKEALVIISTIEPEWSEENLLNFSTTSFFKIQSLWGHQDAEELKKYLSYDLFINWKGQIDDQLKRNEKNVLKGLVISDLFIVDVKNYRNENLDAFTVCFDANADDQTLTTNNILISSKPGSFREFWTFHYENGTWKLFEITQSNGWKRYINGNIIFERIEKAKI